MSYHHFSKYDRGQLQALLEEGFSHRIIAQKLNRHHSSISRKISRNYLGKYQAEKANTTIKSEEHPVNRLVNFLLKLVKSSKRR